MRDAGATTTLLVARSRLVSGDPEAVIEPILAAWPGAGAPPKVVVIALEELLESPRKAAARANAVIALLGEDESNALVYRLEDALGVATRPAIVLRDTPEGSPKPRDADGVLVEPMHADPVYLANALSALMRRQPMIDRLAGELNIAQASLGGVQGQVTRWQDEMQLAASVQREFFPKKTPTPDGLDVGVIFRPAGYVSGDIWDVEQVDEHRTAFFIADAVGHGVPAALLTLVIARSIRKTEGVGADRRVLSPAETLTRLNLEFSERLTDRSRFATAVYGVFDSRSNTVTLAGAGHPPPILSRHGRIERIETDGPLLGVFPEAEYNEVEFVMDTGDVLVLFSDGFETAFPDPGSAARDVRLPTLTYLDKLAEAGADGFKLAQSVRRLEDQLDSQIGSLHQADDVTAILIAPTRVCAGVRAA